MGGVPPFAYIAAIGLLLGVVCPGVHADLAGRVQGTKLFEYVFTEGQDGSNPGFSVDNASVPVLGNLVRIASASSWPLTSVGLQFGTAASNPAAQSTNPFGSLGTGFAANPTTTSLTLELWFRVDSPASTATYGSVVKQIPIVSISSWSGIMVDMLSASPTVTTTNTGFMLNLEPGSSPVFSVVGRDGATLRRRPQTASVTVGALMHYAATITYVPPADPVLASITITSYFNATFGGASTTVTTLTTSAFYPGWDTLKLQFASAMSCPATSTTGCGFRGTVFYAALWPRALTTDEINTNRNAGFANSRPVASDGTVPTQENQAVTFPLNSTDFDGPTGISYIIVTLPPAADGTLTVDSKLLNSTMLPYSVVTNAITFTPFLYRYGNAIGKFTFKAFDGVIDSLSAATVQFNVAFVNQAPTATNFTQTNNYVRQQLASDVTLKGTDIDDIGGVSSGIVRSLPTQGKLYHIVNGGLGGQITTVPTNVNLTIRYVSNATDLSSSGLDIVFTDTFTFSVVDNMGLASDNTATATLPVKNRLQGVNDTSSLDENTNTTVALTGTDSVGQTFSIVINSLPTNGDLYFFNTSTKISSFPAKLSQSDGGQVIYRPKPNLNSRQHGNPLDTVQYYLSSDVFTNFNSSIWAKSFYVNLVNSPPVITTDIPNNAFSVPAGEKASTNIKVMYINVTDIDNVDPGVDYSCVIQIAGYGASFSLTGVSQTTPGYTVFSGSGTRDGIISFKASQTLLAKALYPIYFQSQSTGTKILRISITDNGSPPLLTTQDITIIVTENVANGITANSGSVTIYVILVWVAAIIIPVLCCAMCCLNKYRVWQMKKMNQHLVPHMPVCVHCVVKQWKAVTLQGKRRKSGRGKKMKNQAGRAGGAVKQSRPSIKYTPIGGKPGEYAQLPVDPHSPLLSSSSGGGAAAPLPPAAASSAAMPNATSQSSLLPAKPADDDAE